MPRKEKEYDGNPFAHLAEQLTTQAKRPNVYAYEPHAKQKMFHSSDSKKRLYIGGNRSGKTTGGVIEDIWWCTGRHPFRETPELPVRGRVVSVDFVNGIQKIIIPELSRWVPASDLRGGGWSTAYDKQERTLHFANGSFIEFMSYDQDLDKFAGTSRHFIHFDEEPPEDIYTENLARLVDTGGEFWVTMTPVEGMTWIYDTLYEKGVAGEGGIKVIEVSMTENPHLNAVEVESFLSALSDDERTARERGEFVQLGGLIYKEFDAGTADALGKNIRRTTEPPPKDWVWAVSLDHGFNNPTAVLWHAVSPDGQVITFHEHYKSGWTVDKHAAEIHKINASYERIPDYYIADPSIRNTDPITGTSILEEYARLGVIFSLANNDVDAGIIRVARYMKPRLDGIPNWVCTTRCVELIRELKRYRWGTYANKRIQSQNNNKETPNKKDDHACDSLRYFIMSRPDLSVGFTPSGPEARGNPLQAPKAVEGVLLAQPRKPKHSVWQGEDVHAGWQYDEAMGGEW